MAHFKLDLAQSLAHLQSHPKASVMLFQHGSLEAELYKPHEIDKQTPHQKDEIYVVASGTANFELEGERTTVKAGDFLFAPALKVYRFSSFSDDFSTWVFFYGPSEGEKSQMINHLTK